ncbi:UNVERIFIED_ORG: hypothetical protein LHJ69_11245 [Shinella sp. XGS7]|nr:papain-like cysteine protease family protein [Shinella sp. XGS7]
MKRALLAIGFAIQFFFVSALAQPVPPPVDIPIQNIPQETPVWCWVAVAQQIVLATRGPQNTPPQCALVAMANNAHPSVCCNGPNPACVTTGSIPQIQGLIAYFGGRYSTYAPPANPMALYSTLASGRAIILQLRTGQTSAHVVVVRGMSFISTPMGVQPVLHINDPMAMFTQPVPFAQIAPIWMSAIVVN